MYDDMVRKLESQEEDGLEVRTYVCTCLYLYIPYSGKFSQGLYFAFFTI